MSRLLFNKGRDGAGVAVVSFIVGLTWTLALPQISAAAPPIPFTTVVTPQSSVPQSIVTQPAKPSVISNIISSATPGQCMDFHCTDTPSDSGDSPTTIESSVFTPKDPMACSFVQSRAQAGNGNCGMMGGMVAFSCDLPPDPTCACNAIKSGKMATCSPITISYGQPGCDGKFGSISSVSIQTQWDRYWSTISQCTRDSLPPPSTGSTIVVAPIAPTIGKTDPKGLLKCPPGSPDCRPCADPNADSLSCTTNNLTPDSFAQVAALTAGQDLISSARKNTDVATGHNSGASLLSSNLSTNDSNAKGANGSGTPFIGSGDKTNPIDGKASDEDKKKKMEEYLAAGGNGAYSSGSGRSDASRSGGSGSGDRSVDQSGEATGALHFAAGGDGKGTKGSGVGTSDGKGNASGTYDPDNSDTWSEELKRKRLAEALAMDPDVYFRLIPAKESLFHRIHERYEKIAKRWNPPKATPAKKLP